MHYCPDAEVVTLLADRGAKVDDRDTFGETALMRCVSLGVPRAPRYLDTIRRLMELGADPLLRNNEGKSAFDLARHGDGKPDAAAALEQWSTARRARP
jgi:ankyrin repeat protein